MKIVHVSNFTIKQDGANSYGIQHKLSNGLTRLGHHVFRFSDRDVADANILRIRAAGRRHANKKLGLVCQQLRPDLLLLGHATLISPATLTSIRSENPSIRIAHWNCDPIFIPSNLKLLQSFAPHVDLTFITTSGKWLEQLASSGRAAYMPNPVDSSIETGRAFDRLETDTDLVFFGRPNAERTAICELIRSRIPDLRFFVGGVLGTPEVRGARMQDVLHKAKMGFSFSRIHDALLFSSDRMAAYMGNGVLTFVDRRTGFGSLFAENELVCYSDSEDLIAKLRYFKVHDDERRAQARRGWQRVHDFFSETLVAKWIVEATFGERLSESYAWPTDILGRD